MLMFMLVLMLKSKCEPALMLFDTTKKSVEQQILKFTLQRQGKRLERIILIYILWNKAHKHLSTD